jgi:hypothetical protein
LDIFTVGFVFMLCLAAFYFRRSFVLRSYGRLLFGIASIFIALTLIMIKYEFMFYYFFLAGACIFVLIGDVILMTKERFISKAYRRQSGKNEEIRNIESRKIHGRKITLGGFLIIFAGIVVFFWRKEIIFPLYIVMTGIVFLITGRLYSNRKENHQSNSQKNEIKNDGK